MVKRRGITVMNNNRTFHIFIRKTILLRKNIPHKHRRLLSQLITAGIRPPELFLKIFPVPHHMTEGLRISQIYFPTAFFIIPERDQFILYFLIIHPFLSLCLY